MANKPGRSMSQTSHERSCFQMIAARVRIPATTPNAMVSKPEKWMILFETVMNNTVNRPDSPTAHHPSRVCGIPKNFPC